MADRIRRGQALRAYENEIEKRQSEAKQQAANHVQAIRIIQNKIDRLSDAIANGADAITEIVERLKAASAEKVTLLENKVEDDAATMIVLKPDLAKAYGMAVTGMAELFARDGSEAIGAKNSLRALVDRIILMPTENVRGMSIELAGRLASGPLRHAGHAIRDISRREFETRALRAEVISSRRAMRYWTV